MPEIMPRFVQKPDGVLEVKVGESDLWYDQQTSLARALDELKKLPEFAYDEVSDGHGPVVVAQLDTVAAFDALQTKDPATLEQFLQNISNLIQHPQVPKTDFIVDKASMTKAGLSVLAYDHFQRWLQTPEARSEVVAQEVLQAMAIPFGSETREEVRKDFKIAGGMARAAHLGFGVFDDTRLVHTDQYREIGGVLCDRGDATLARPHLETFGPFPFVFDAPIADDEFIDISPETEEEFGGRISPWLRELHTYGEGVPREVLSMFLGVGAMAYRASQYTGTEPVVDEASIEWDTGI